MKIVYNSNSGHTKEYAEMLGSILKIESISLKDYKKDDEPIIFMGWVFGSMIMGLNKVMDSKKICVCAVGMSKESKENTDNIIKVNNYDGKLFYLRGGVDYKKLKGIKKMMLKMVGNKTIKENKEEDKDIIEVFKNGGNFIKKENLNEVIDYINKR